MRYKNGLIAVACFVSGAAAALSVPPLFRLAASKLLFPQQRTEVFRATSPDGRVDAVAERIECGAPCSSAYVVSVVPKGAARPAELAQQTFAADEIVNPEVKWDEPHLLEIGYDKALVEEFRNLAYPFGRPGDIESWRYQVEVRLSPSSSRFSYLSRDDK
jgi:hypothetical protein